MFLCPRRVRRRHDIRGLALSVWELFRPVHTIAADVVSVLCWCVLVVVFLYDRRARAVLWTGPTPPWVPFLSIRRHASSNGRATAARERATASLCRCRTNVEGRGSSTTFVHQRGDGAAG
jgi:hypothetical protein